MNIFQLLSLCFAFFMIYVASIHARKSNINLVEASFWYSLWFLFIVITLFPNLLLGIAHALSFSRIFDLLVVGALMILTVLIILNYFQQKTNNKKLEKLVRLQAIKERLKNAKK